MNKRGEFNFVLLFAIIAGIAILLLSIYGAIKSGESLTTGNEAELAKSLEIVTDPLQAGFADASTARIIFKKETKINSWCESYAGFGENIISVQTKSSVGGEWTVDPLQYTIHNKYLFSDPSEGKTFYVLSKPFETGYKVADLLFISPKKFCFVFPPEHIAEEISGLMTTNIGLRLESGNNTCDPEATTVCFKGGGCNLTVIPQCNEQRCKSEYDIGIVADSMGNQVSYSGSLLYGAIYFDKDMYECNVKRLTYRASRIATLYAQKIDLMAMRGCDSLLKADLISFSAMLQNATSKNLEQIYYTSNDLVVKENREGCGLW
jgi:hypothetical protein